jgi:hypothetical protein
MFNALVRYKASRQIQNQNKISFPAIAIGLFNRALRLVQADLDSEPEAALTRLLP